MVRYRMRSPSEGPHQGPGQEHGREGQGQGQGLSPENAEDYGRTHRCHYHRRRRCSRRRLHRIHRRRPVMQEAKETLLPPQEAASQRLQKIPKEEEVQVQEVQEALPLSLPKPVHPAWSQVTCPSNVMRTHTTIPH